jgi:3-oxoacyl-(acyl-carrier-protein) synthase
MERQALIRGGALACSLGTEMDAVIAAVRDGLTPATLLPLDLAGLPCRRPYYRLPFGDDRREADVERFFYEVLFDTVGRALAGAGWRGGELEEAAFLFGSTSIDIPIYEAAYARSEENGIHFFTHASLGYGSIAHAAADRFGIGGPCTTFTTACTSSANALLYGAGLVETGVVDRAVVAGYDLYNATGFYGFESLRLMAPGRYRPFDARRDGIVMGEGCGVVLLERGRPAAGDFVFRGGANRVDPFNVTTHDENGTAIAATMQAALADAGLDPGAVGAVKAHATGSDLNDRTECAGMRAVFGAAMPPVTAVKPYVGHTVGASGAIELLLVTESLRRGFLPAVPGFEEEDPELGVRPLAEPLPMKAGTVMLNFFGFGGNCTSLIVSGGG